MLNSLRKYLRMIDNYTWPRRHHNFDEKLLIMGTSDMFPKSGWIKLNSDGAVAANCQQVVVGGVLINILLMILRLYMYKSVFFFL